MTTAFDLPEGALKDGERKMLAVIREHGWQGMHVFGDGREGPRFSYTVGLYAKLGFPEVMLFALGNELAQDMFWNLDRAVSSGSPPPVGVPVPGYLHKADVVFLPASVEKRGEYVLSDRWFYRGDDFPCLQLFWPDRKGLFPWQSGFAAEYEGLQPDLTENGWLAHFPN